MVSKAGQVAAQGVAAAADQVDKATGGKYSDKISSVSSKIDRSSDR
ncbi:Rv0909 family putative TA system antitoxin [Jatrophihabitans endophyticus]